MSVSMNQSLKDAFGSGVVIPDTGVLLQNRGANFTPDTYVPGTKVPQHTLAPAMVLRDGEPLLIFGAMGGPSQTQIHLQLLARILIAGEPIAEAIAAPRWRVYPDRLIAEEGLPDLGAQPAPLADMLGHAHAIMVAPDGSLSAAFDPRSDGAAVGY
jgi:gamma-glutamyltranspeptidase/glutathione hydrolase